MAAAFFMMDPNQDLLNRQEPLLTIDFLPGLLSIRAFPVAISNAIPV
jgi:hypothetical protein